MTRECAVRTGLNPARGVIPGSIILIQLDPTVNVTVSVSIALQSSRDSPQASLLLTSFAYTFDLGAQGHGILGIMFLMIALFGVDLADHSSEPSLV